MEKKKYRIRRDDDPAPVYRVQVRVWWFWWVTIKTFYDPWEPFYAMLCASELMEALDE